eukprot:6181167-Pleurochrysis_carterae.AAC.1
MTQEHIEGSQGCTRMTKRGNPSYGGRRSYHWTATFVWTARSNTTRTVSWPSRSAWRHSFTGCYRPEGRA